MDNIMTVPPAYLPQIAEAVTRADATGRDLHLAFGESKRGKWFKWKVGYGMWSAPIYGLPYNQ